MLTKCCSIVRAVYKFYEKNITKMCYLIKNNLKSRYFCFNIFLFKEASLLSFYNSCPDIFKID